MKNAYLTIEVQSSGLDTQIAGFYAIWYNNGSGTSCTIAENIANKEHAETMVAALDATTIE